MILVNMIIIIIFNTVLQYTETNTNSICHYLHLVQIVAYLTAY